MCAGLKLDASAIILSFQPDQAKMNFVLLLVSNLLATTVASGARVEVQANGAINIASQGTLNVGASDSDLAAKVEELETWKTTMEAQMEHVLKTIAVITPPPSSLPSLPPISWSNFSNTNCYPPGHTQDDNRPGAGAQNHECCPRVIALDLSLEQCKQSCLNTTGCDGIIFDDAAGRCWLRHDIDLASCITPYLCFGTYVLTRG